MNPAFKKMGLTPTAALAFRATGKTNIEAAKARRAEIRLSRNMEGAFENRASLQHRMANAAKMAVKKASVGQEPAAPTRPERWTKK